MKNTVILNAGKIMGQHLFKTEYQDYGNLDPDNTQTKILVARHNFDGDVVFEDEDGKVILAMPSACDNILQAMIRLYEPFGEKGEWYECRDGVSIWTGKDKGM